MRQGTQNVFKEVKIRGALSIKITPLGQVRSNDLIYNNSIQTTKIT